MSATEVDASPAPPEGLRRRAARGTVINAGFLVALQSLGFLKGFIVAAYLSTTDYGLWGLLVITLGTVLTFAQVGIEDKYIQQDHADQERAFHIAFTLQCLLAGAIMLVIAILLPVFALVYDESRIIAPGLVLALAMPAAALQTPLWTFYKRMEFFRQRVLQSFDPIASFVITVALAVAGFGYWALVVGTLAGGWAAAIAAVRASPYSLRLHWERGALREYVGFSWPLFVGSACSVFVVLVPILVAQRSLGVAAVGAITLAGTIALYAQRVDDVVTNTLYPAICAVKDRRDLLFESFTKSNRLALLWGVPCGVAMTLFAQDLVDYVIGDKWDYAVPVIQVFGLCAALAQLGFNWTAFFRARGETRPMAVAGAVSVISTGAIVVPLILTQGLDGYAIGIAATTVIYTAVRLIYLSRLFPAFSVLRHSARSVWPTAAGAAAVLAVRELGDPARTEAWALAEVGLFVAIVAACTIVSERALLREMAGYLRRRPAPA